MHSQLKSQLHPLDEDEVLGLLLLMDAVGDGGVGGDGDGEGLGQEGLQVDTHHPAGEDGATCKEGGYRGRCLSMFIAGSHRITYDFIDQLSRPIAVIAVIVPYSVKLPVSRVCLYSSPNLNSNHPYVTIPFS